MTGPTGPTGPTEPGDDPEERDPGLARERTALSWTRTAISFAALGGTMLKANVVTGLIILAVTPLIWQLGRVTRGRAVRTDLPAVGPMRLFVITASIVAVSLLCLVIAIFGKSVPGALRLEREPTARAAAAPCSPCGIGPAPAGLTPHGDGCTPRVGHSRTHGSAFTAAHGRTA